MNLLKAIFWSTLFILLSGFSIPSDGQESDGVILIDKRVHKRYNNGYLLNIAYPQICYVFEQESHEVNVFLQGIMWRAIEDFINRIEASGERPTAEGTPHHLYISYHVYMKNANVISIKFFRQMQVTADGKAKNAYMHTTVNYLLSEKGQLSLDAIFLPNTPYSEALSKYIHKVYGERISPENIREYAKFCVSEDNLVLSFAGPQFRHLEKNEFLIPWNALAPIIDHAGPIWKLKIKD